MRIFFLECQYLFLIKRFRLYRVLYFPLQSWKQFDNTDQYFHSHSFCFSFLKWLQAIFNGLPRNWILSKNMALILHHYGGRSKSVGLNLKRFNLSSATACFYLIQAHETWQKSHLLSSEKSFQWDHYASLWNCVIRFIQVWSLYAVS